MPTLLDSLVIQLNLDGKNVAKGAQQAGKSLKTLEGQADHTAGTLSEAGKTAADGFSRARTEALALLAVFTGGRSLKAFTSEITRTNAELGYTAQRLNMDPGNLYRMQKGIEAMGGTAGEAAASMQSMQQALTDPESAARLMNTMGNLGLRSSDYMSADGQNITEDILKKLNRSTQGMNQIAKNSLLQSLGFGPGEINEINLTTRAFDKLQAQLKDTAPTPQQIRDSQQLLSDWTAMTAETEKLGRSILGDLMPGIDKAVTAFTAWEKANEPLAKEIGETALAVGGLITALGGLATAKGLLTLLRLPKMLSVAGGAVEAGTGLGLLGTAGVMAGGLIAGKATETGGPVEQWAKRKLGDSNAVRWFFGDHERGSAKQAMTMLQGMGFSRNAALGVVGNIAQESRFDPNARGDHGTAYGLGQWHNDRVEEILKGTGIDVRDASFEDQIKAYAWELKHGTDGGARKAGRLLDNPNISAWDAIHAVRAYGERPADVNGTEDYNRYLLATQAASPPQQTAQNKTEIHVGDIHVTAHGNANGQQIARDVHTELKRILPHTAATGLA
ncbi:MAG: phage tail tip lysozyme [Gluconobacter sp.]|uniref:phage tail tip lysozyme n=1 Tax=Gluconobacter sp. TaxID=1876758 RepID=UPI0039EA712D